MCIYAGTVYDGRDDIAAGHQALFDSVLKGTTMVNEIDEVRFYGPGTAVVAGRGDVAKKRGKLTKVRTCTVVREGDGTWRIASFHNTKRRPLMEAVSFTYMPASRPRR
ncbi:SgcJ/EcaC family oxidoreductase [Nonomuraea phyllanthi]|uniref:SgcJ/EcaC family oxidoreductase n=1 Tax=Nonomuraea phyllanthi TaxID=2219224 RepID=A0A5C4VM59_9ACTN|nr:SgcJ/EcaC family oxidoreductase [Nonomuraea phyllanthi]